MATQIFDQQSCIRIAYEDRTIYVHKEQIITVDTLHGDTVRIDIGEGALRHIYVRLQDVNSAEGRYFGSVEELRDFIKAMLDTWPVLSTGEGATGYATAANQEVEMAQLTGISQLLSDIKMLLANNATQGEASRIDESQPYIVYKGFAVPGTEPAEAKWAIQKVTRHRETDLIEVEWADGNSLPDNVWDSRLLLTYLPLDLIPRDNPTRDFPALN